MLVYRRATFSEAKLVPRLFALDQGRICGDQFKYATKMETEQHYHRSHQASNTNLMSTYSNHNNYANVLHQYHTNYTPCLPSDYHRSIAHLGASELEHHQQRQPGQSAICSARLPAPVATTTAGISYYPNELPAPAVAQPDQDHFLSVPTAGGGPTGGCNPAESGAEQGGGDRGDELNQTRPELFVGQETAAAYCPAATIPVPPLTHYQHLQQQHQQHQQQQLQLQHHYQQHYQAQNQHQHQDQHPHQHHQPQQHQFYQQHLQTTPAAYTSSTATPEAYPFQPSHLAYNQQHQFIQHQQHQQQLQQNCSPALSQHQQRFYTSEAPLGDSQASYAANNYYGLPPSYKSTTSNQYYDIHPQTQLDSGSRQSLAPCTQDTGQALELEPPPVYSSIFDTCRQAAAPDSAPPVTISSTNTYARTSTNTTNTCTTAAAGTTQSAEQRSSQQHRAETRLEPFTDENCEDQHHEHQNPRSSTCQFEPGPAYDRLHPLYRQQDQQLQRQRRTIQMCCVPAGCLAGALAACRDSRSASPGDDDNGAAGAGAGSGGGGGGGCESQRAKTKRETAEAAAKVRAGQTDKRNGQSGPAAANCQAVATTTVTGSNGLVARRKNATRETTAMLKDWLDEHGQNPYPTKGEKIMLSIITKMSLTQVSTWFANARRRMKKDNKALAWATIGDDSHQGQLQIQLQLPHQNRCPSGPGQLTSPNNSNSDPLALSASGLDDSIAINAGARSKPEQPIDQPLHPWSAKSTTDDFMAAPQESVNCQAPVDDETAQQPGGPLMEPAISESTG